jgi:hypothetical protein
MASTTLQNLVQQHANLGVVVTGTRKDMVRAAGCPIPSLPRLALAEPFSARTNPDNPGVLRAGRSASLLGVVPSAGSYPRVKAMMWPRIG